MQGMPLPPFRFPRAHGSVQSARPTGRSTRSSCAAHPFALACGAGLQRELGCGCGWESGTGDPHPNARCRIPSHAPHSTRCVVIVPMTSRIYVNARRDVSCLWGSVFKGPAGLGGVQRGQGGGGFSLPLHSHKSIQVLPALVMTPFPPSLFPPFVPSPRLGKLLQLRGPGCPPGERTTTVSSPVRAQCNADMGQLRNQRPSAHPQLQAGAPRSTNPWPENGTAGDSLP